MVSKICIVTPSGMVCEATSYEGRGLSRTQKATKVPRAWEARVNTLMKLAKAKDAPFMIISKPGERRPRK